VDDIAKTHSDTRSEWARRIGVGERQYLYGRHVGTIDHRPVVRDDNGKIGGEQHHHWDGSVDATVHASPIKARMHISAKYYKETEIL
jgi:hypothetical protein